ncbi:hypothetical protein GE061_011265 [Apolygus lucorum]|uniref:DUF4780 domain-containing protein n=1 Tax=Apolygus lucorum TaxID=248454 RepID=A0A8S9Y0Y6_APOLU|nr:hypothetical protein GE061_011265 [Apolygus lucorum]
MNTGDSEIQTEDEERLLKSPPSDQYEEAMETVENAESDATEAPLNSEQHQPSGSSTGNPGHMDPKVSTPREPSDEETPAWVKKYRNLNGAGKRRFTWCLRHGRTHEEAAEEASNPIPEEALKKRREAKRRRTSAENTPESQKGATKKKRVSFRDTRPPRRVTSYKDAVVGRKVGILDVNYPETLLMFEQMLRIQESILQGIVDQEGIGPKPVFLDSTYRRGWLSITCGNDTTLEWLKNHMANSRPCEETNLKLVEGADLPHPHIVFGYFPNSADDAEERILALIKGQNEGLHVEHWRTLSRLTEGTMTKLTLSVDTASAAVLRAGNKINYKFGKAVMKIKRNTKRAGAASEAEGESETDVESMDKGTQETRHEQGTGAGAEGSEPEPEHTAPLAPVLDPGLPSASAQRTPRPYPLPIGHPSARHVASPGTSSQQRPLDSSSGGTREGKKPAAQKMANSGKPPQQRPLASTSGGSQEGQRASMKQQRPQLHGTAKRKPGRPQEEWQRRKKGGRGRGR